jgi:hypothetical protein
MPLDYLLQFLRSPGGRHLPSAAGEPREACVQKGLVLTVRADAKLRPPYRVAFIVAEKPHL